MEWEEDPGLPIKFGPCSNGEYEPQALSPVVAEAVRRARKDCEINARRIGMSRRRFLLSLCGAATTLLALDACTREAHRAASARPTTDPGGSYSIPPEATTEPAAAEEVLGGEEFVFDIQGHLLDYELNPILNGQDFWRLFPQKDCGESDPRLCYSIDHFMELMFLRSDTSMLVLSALPIYPKGSPLAPEVMEETRLIAEALCHDERVLLHAQALPNVGSLSANLDAMEETVRRHRVSAWKTFTHFPDVFEHNGSAWQLDDHDPRLPQVGDAFIRKAVELGVPIICTHKGFSGGSLFASPADVGPAARKHPDATFVVYHSGYEAGQAEGPFTQATAGLGVNRLIDSLRQSGVGPNENVYAELGSTWWSVMRSPTEAAHVLGKLLKHVGPDNVVWGTDCLFYGSPQDQIQALRAFRISDELQERYGYPKLTGELKAKILGLNGAMLYGVDPVATRCEFTRKELSEVRMSLPGGDRTLGPSTSAEVRSYQRHHRGWP